MLTGFSLPYFGSDAPEGYLLLDGKSIGTPASGASSRANYDTWSLYQLLWNSMANEFAPVSGGRGENALSDFQANKFLTLPDARGRTLAGKDNMGGTPADRLKSHIAGAYLGAYGGEEVILLEAGNIPHPLQVDLSVNTDGSSVGGSASVQGSSAGPSGTVPTAGNTSGGSVTAHNNVQPTLVSNWIIKL